MGFGRSGSPAGCERVMMTKGAPPMSSARKLKVSTKGAADLKAALDSHAIVTITDPQGRITYANDKFCSLSKYLREELIGQDHRLTSSGHHPKDFIRNLWTTIEQGNVWKGEIKNRAKDGSFYWVDTVIVPVLGANGKPRQYVAVRADITELKEREYEFARLSRLYSALSQINQAIVWGAPTRDELFRKICRILCEHGGFHMAWIGWNNPESHQLEPVAEWGDASGYLRRIRIHTDDRPEGRGPTGTAFREGRPYICNDLLNDAAMLLWRAEAERSGYRASAVFPIREDDQVRGTLTVYADEAGFFRDKEISLLEEAAHDVSFALGNFAREAARRQAEQTVRQERDFSEALLNSLPGVFYLYNRAGRFLRWNKNFEHVTGYTAAEIMTLHPLDFFPVAGKQLIAARIEEVFEKGESYVEAVFLTKGGQLIPYCFTGVRVEIEGQTCLVGVGVDLSARREAEEARRVSEARYRTLFDYAPDGIMIADPKSYYLDANDSICRMLGYTRDELIGLHASDIVAPAELTHIGEALHVIKAKSQYHREWQFRRKDGSAFPAEVIATMMPDGNLLAMIRDITERRRSEDELRTAGQQLHALVGRMNTVREEEAKRIARELHDDLGQHLTALNMELADLELKLADCTARQRDQFARMRAGVDHTIEVVQKISGELRLGQLDVLGLTAAIEWQVQEFSKRSAISCRIARLDESTELNDAQSTALFRILQETLTNIARHAGATEVEVSLEAGPDQVILRVRDNGRGITAAEIGDQKAIGLLGMRERAQLVGGEVSITGAAGKGTTVLVRIPRHPPAPKSA